MSAAQRFVLRISPVEAWPKHPPRNVTYAYAADVSLEALAARLAHELAAEVITEDAVFNNTNCRPPTNPPVPSETLP